MKMQLFSFQECGVWQLIFESIKLGDKLFPSYWCMISFLVGSILAQLNFRSNAGFVACLLQIGIFYAIGLVYVSACLMGYLVYLCISKLNIRKIVLMLSGIISLIFLYLLYKCFFFLPESNEKYLVEGGMAAFIVFSVVVLDGYVLNEKRIRICIFEKYMAMYLLHYIVYMTIGAWLFHRMNGFYYAYWINCAACILIIFVLSFPLDFTLKKLVEVSMKSGMFVSKKIYHV